MTDKNNADKKDPTEGRFDFLINLGRLAVYALLTTAIFLIISIFIFSIRSEDSRAITMPDLAGRYYLDVHNDLASSRLRITLHHRYYPELTPGIIIGQNVEPGSKVHPRDQVRLTVNRPEPILTVPDLIGTPASAAEASLARLPYGDEVFSLDIGSISFVASEERTSGTIIEQVPRPGEKVAVNSRVSLLVSTGPSDSQDTAETMQSFEGESITLAQSYMERSGIEYRISNITRPERIEDNGRIYSVEQDGNTYNLSVYYRPSGINFVSGYEKVSLRLNPAEKCMVELYPETEELRSVTYRLLEARQISERENIDLIFFRQGNRELKVICDEREVYSKLFQRSV